MVALENARALTVAGVAKGTAGIGATFGQDAVERCSLDRRSGMEAGVLLGQVAGNGMDESTVLAIRATKEGGISSQDATNRAR